MNRCHSQNFTITPIQEWFKKLRRAEQMLSGEEHWLDKHEDLNLQTLSLPIN